MPRIPYHLRRQILRRPAQRVCLARQLRCLVLLEEMCLRYMRAIVYFLREAEVDEF